MTRSRLLALAFGLLLVLSSLGAGALAQPGYGEPDDRPGRPDDAPGRNGTGNDTGDDRARPDGERGPPSWAPVPDRLGRFQPTNGAADGRYVTFNYTEDPAALTDVRAGGMLLFDEVSVDANATSRMRGVLFQLAYDDGAIVLYDNPAVVLRASAPNATITVDLADDLNVSGNATHHRVLHDGGLVGHLIFSSAPSAGAGANAFLANGSVRFIAAGHAANVAADPVRSAVADAASQRRMGAELTFVPNGTGMAGETILYDDMNVTVQAAERGRVRFLVDGGFQTGRVVLLNAGPGLLEDGELQLSYYDVEANETVEVPFREASGLRDVMNPNDDSTPEYLVVPSANGTQVVVSVPHFSAHIVEIQSLVQAPPPSIVLGLVGGLAFIAIAAGNLFRRGRD